MRIIYIRDGEILQLAFPLPLGNPDEGLQPDGTFIVYSENLGGLNDHEFMELRYWDGTSIQERPRRPNDLCIWINGNWVVNESLYLSTIRFKRDMLLYRTDWTQLNDAPITEAQIIEATIYRQALRDMTDPIITNPQAYMNIEDAPWPSPLSFLNVS